MKVKLKSYSFWVKIISVLIIIANIITSKFGYRIDSALIFDIATIVATLFVVLGVITEPTGISENNENINNKKVGGVMEQIKKDLVEEVENMVFSIEKNDSVLLNEILDRIKLKLESIKKEDIDELKDEESSLENIDIAQENEEGANDDFVEEVDDNEQEFVPEEEMSKKEVFDEIKYVEEVVIEKQVGQAIKEEDVCKNSEDVKEDCDIVKIENVSSMEENERAESCVEINGEKYIAKIVDGRALLEKV